MAFFPNFSQFPPYVRTELNRRVNEPQEVSKLNAWVRVSSAVSSNGMNGLSLVSNPDYDLFSAASVASVYGAESLSGTIGTTWEGAAVNVKDDIGYRPKPNITSIEIDEGMGALSRKATFSITAYTLGQLNELCKYFLEPGFTVFLEWGWNTGKAVGQIADLKKAVTSIDVVSKYQSFDNVNIARAGSEGCYDNYLGFITGGGIAMEGDHWVITTSCTGFTELPAFLMVADNAQSTETTDSNGTEIVDDVNTAGNFTQSEIDAEMGGDKTADTSKKRFMLMFNDLPSTRKTNEVRALINNPKVYNYKYFINFDLEIRAMLNRQKKVSETGDTDLVKLPAGTKLVGDERFIHFGALMEIINANGVDAFKVGSTQVLTKIHVDDTVISAFKRIFSHDKSKLFIPNRYTPAFSIDFAAHNTSRQIDFTAVNDNHILTDANGNPVTFPCETSKTDGTIVQHISYQYGYLKELYVNFDFVTGILETKNLSMKDALHQILNGMSSAVGGMWDFQIQEMPADIKMKSGKTVKTTILSVIDLNCVSSTTEEPHTFYAIGARSIFMDANMDMDIGGAKMNQIIGNRLAASTGKVLNSSQPTVQGNLFSTSATDMILDGITYTKITPSQDKVTDGKEREKEVNANLQSYLNDVGMYPRQNSQTTNRLDKFLYIACFNSQTIFDALKNNNDIVTIANNGGVSPLLPINFTFTIHGISGIQRGSKFKVFGLPAKYSSDGFFQVTSVKHIIDGMLWKTEVSGGFRIQNKKYKRPVPSGLAKPKVAPTLNANNAQQQGPDVSNVNTADKLWKQ